MSNDVILDVQDLRSVFHTPNGDVTAVDGISFTVSRGETVALVGESGSGKSVSAFSVMQLVERNVAHPTGKVLFHGEDILTMPYAQRRDLRGKGISIIFQEPGTSLNPVFTVGEQVAEVLRLHEGIDHAEARKRTVSLFDEVGIPDPDRRYDAWPHELSGGMKQRVMIAMAIACQPDLLIADEPTTALDVTIQAQILQLLRRIQRDRNMGMLLITHDLGVVNEVADRVLVMYRGNLVEEGPRYDLIKNPQHEYTRHLIEAVPGARREGGHRVADDAPELVRTEDLKVWFPIREGMFRRTVDHVKAVDGVDFTIRQGETLALVGESGSGKTTVGKALARLQESTSGKIFFENHEITHLDKQAFRPWRQRIQVIFQDPGNSLDPRMFVKDIIGEGLHSFDLVDSASAYEDRVADLLRRVELDPAVMRRYPHEFSGGQRQRICIARALAVDPEFVVCDEATSALDVSVQAGVLALLNELQESLGLTYLFITHDLSVVRHIADRVTVMQYGKIVESGETEALFEQPEQEYTRRLLNSAPSMDPDNPQLGLR